MLLHLLNRDLLAFLIFIIASLPVMADRNKPYDRSQWFEPETETSDDLRRVPVPKGHANHGDKIVLVGGRLFDGTGQSAYLATVVIEGKKINAILKPGVTDYPQDAEIVDVTGKTVMPGLIDMHVHITYLKQFGQSPELTSQSQADAALRGVERLRYYLKSGVTTVRDVGSHGMAPFILKKYIADDNIPGPRIFSAGQIIVGQGGHATEWYLLKTAPTHPDAMIYEASGPDGWRNAVRNQFKKGADHIKLASHYTQKEIEAAVDEAHRLGLRVTVDAETQYIDMAINAGVDSIEHPMARSDKAILLMAKNNIAAIPTVWILNKVIASGKGGYWGSMSRRFTTSKNISMGMLRKLKDANVKMGVGTDLVTDLYTSMPDPYIGELKNFQAVGYSAEEALVAATKTNAEILGMDDKLGTVETGKLADIIIIDGNPDKNLEKLSNVEMVLISGKFKVKEGRMYIPSK